MNEWKKLCHTKRNYYGSFKKKYNETLLIEISMDKQQTNNQKYIKNRKKEAKYCILKPEKKCLALYDEIGGSNLY